MGTGAGQQGQLLKWSLSKGRMSIAKEKKPRLNFNFFALLSSRKREGRIEYERVTTLSLRLPGGPFPTEIP